MKDLFYQIGTNRVVNLATITSAERLRNGNLSIRTSDGQFATVTKPFSEQLSEAVGLSEQPVVTDGDDAGSDDSAASGTDAAGEAENDAGTGRKKTTRKKATGKGDDGKGDDGSDSKSE